MGRLASSNFWLRVMFIGAVIAGFSLIRFLPSSLGGAVYSLTEVDCTQGYMVLFGDMLRLLCLAGAFYIIGFTLFDLMDDARSGWIGCKKKWLRLQQRVTGRFKI